jgi:hypothetical protein
LVVDSENRTIAVGWFAADDSNVRQAGWIGTLEECFSLHMQWPCHLDDRLQVADSKALFVSVKTAGCNA